MPHFAYTGIGAKGNTATGLIVAASREAALANLRQQNIKPLNIKEAQIAKKFSLRRAKVKTRDLVLFTRQLSTMVSAGVPLTQALATLQAQTTNKLFKEQLTAVVKDVESGISLADALEKHPSTFSSVYVNMVRAGETGGILDDILKRLALQQEKDAAIKAKVKSASTYPMVLLTITVLAFFVLTIFVVPKIAGLVTNLGGPGAHLPPQTAAMLAVSKFLRHQWYIVIALFIGGPIWVRRWKKTPNGRKHFDAILLKIPVIKTVVTKVAVARFARTFSALMGAGVSVLESLQVTAQAMGNSVIEQELIKASKEVKNGRQLSQPLSQSKFFPPIVSQMLAVGEETGKTDVILIKVADFYEEEVDSLVSGLSSVLEPIMIVVMGGMVGLIAASVIGPIAGLAQQIK